MRGIDSAPYSICELAPLIKSGEVSAIDLAESALNRMAEVDPELNAFITTSASDAVDAACSVQDAIRAGRYPGPLAGIPIAVKDLFATRGVRTTAGSMVLADWIPDYDATVVERLRQAGAVIVGKTNMHELAYGTTSNNPHYGAVRNPWKLTHHPGGSSGGSAAAVSAGLAVAAIGTDTGGSIRQPAACCGIVGMKPTYGRISKYGAVPLAWSMDHVGPLTTCVRDCAIMLDVLAGHDGRDPTSARQTVPKFEQGLSGGIAGVRIGVAREFFFERCEEDTVLAVEESLRVFRELNAEVVEIALPDVRAAFAAASLIIAVEAATYHADELRSRPDLFSAELKELLGLGGLYKGTHYVQAQRLRSDFSARIIESLKGVQVIVLPTSPICATPVADATPGREGLRVRNTLPFSFVGLPAVSVPCGLSNAGLPIGLQIVGNPFEERQVLNVAYAYERSTAWHKRRPGLCMG